MEAVARACPLFEGLEVVVHLDGKSVVAIVTKEMLEEISGTHELPEPAWLSVFESKRDTVQRLITERLDAAMAGRPLILHPGYR